MLNLAITNKSVKFLYILDSTSLQNIIRIFEISKRLLRFNVKPIILTQKLGRRPLNNILVNKLTRFLNVHKSFFIEINRNFIIRILDIFINIDFYLSWIPFAYLKARKIIKNNNIKFIYVSGPHFYTHILGYLLKIKHKIPLIIEYRDPWSLNPYSLADNNQFINKVIDYQLENRILKSADYIITISNELKYFLKQNFQFIKNKKIITIPNGINILKMNKHLNGNKSKIILIFTGSLYGKRSILPFMLVLSQLKQENYFNDINFLLKIYGSYDKNLIKSIKYLNIEDIVILGGQVSRFKALREISRSNLALHIGENFNYPTIAFKVWDYLSCRKFILFLGYENSLTARFLKRYDFGITLPLNKLNEIKNKFINVIDRIRLNEFNNLINEKQLKNFTWKNRAHKFLNKIIKERFYF